MSDKTRVGIIGAGRVAKTHIQSFQETGEADIVAIWNRTRQKAVEIAQRYELPRNVVYDTWEAMIDDASLDIVSVVTAPQLRKGPIVRALKKGIHVLSEKPFAQNLREAREMVKAARASQCATAVCFTYHYKPVNISARKIIQSGELGDITHYSGELRLSWPSDFSVSERPYFIESKSGLGMIGEIGSHQFDMVPFLIGQNIRDIAGLITWAHPDSPELRTNKEYHFAARGNDGACITISQTVPPGERFSQSSRRIYIQGTKGILVIEGGFFHKGVVTVRLENEKQMRIVPPDYREDDIHPKTKFAKNFIALAKSGNKEAERPELLPSFEDGYRSLAVLEAALVAEREKTWITAEGLPPG